MNEKFEKLKNFIYGKRIAMIGAGISNMSSIDILRSFCADITVRDKNPNPTYTPDGEGGDAVEVKPILDKLGIKTYFGDGYLDGLTEEIILKTPVVRFDVPQIAEAVKNGSVLTSEAELFCRFCPCRIFAVTGSDGKTTTTTLIYKILSKQYEGTDTRVWLGGNIGTPLLQFIGSVGENDFAVLELSSFQLQTMDFKPYRSVITNITPNHLNWHTDMNEYVDSKAHIFSGQRDGDRLILNAENEYTEKFLTAAKCDVTLFSSKRGMTHTDSVYLDGDSIVYYDGKKAEKIINTEDIRIVGNHNIENYMAAIAATRGMVSNDTVYSVAQTFAGVRHRIEEVCEKNGVKYYNSSIDTTPSRTIAALESFKGGVVLICGGSDKNLPLDTLIPVIAGKTKFVCATGTTGKKIYGMLAEYGYPPDKLIYEKDFDSAVKLASEKAEKGDSVLLSPAAASFDSFRNFERRGDRFCEIVKNL